MSERMGIVVVGAVFVDIKGYPNGLYIPAGRNAGRVLQVDGGVSRNVVEDIANLELRPTYISVVDHGGISTDVLERLKRHKVNTDYVRRVEDGLGTWLAIFDHKGDVVGSISKRPDLSEIYDILIEHGDAVISGADSVIVEIDMEPAILKVLFSLAEKYHKDIYAVVSNMSIAVERRDLLKRTACFVCNEQEAEILFSENYDGMDVDTLARTLCERIRSAQIRQIIVTLGEKGCVYADQDGTFGFCPPQETIVVDTTGAGDAFLAGAATGLTYGKSLAEACVIGTRLASSVIATKENVCPRFLPEEFGLCVIEKRPQ